MNDTRSPKPKPTVASDWTDEKAGEPDGKWNLPHKPSKKRSRTSYASTDGADSYTITPPPPSTAPASLSLPAAAPPNASTLTGPSPSATLTSTILNPATTEDERALAKKSSILEYAIAMSNTMGNIYQSKNRQLQDAQQLQKMRSHKQDLDMSTLRSETGARLGALQRDLEQLKELGRMRDDDSTRQWDDIEAHAAQIRALEDRVLAIENEVEEQADRTGERLKELLAANLNLHQRNLAARGGGDTDGVSEEDGGDEDQKSGMPQLDGTPDSKLAVLPQSSSLKGQSAAQSSSTHHASPAASEDQIISGAAVQPIEHARRDLVLDRLCADMEQLKQRDAAQREEIAALRDQKTAAKEEIAGLRAANEALLARLESVERQLKVVAGDLLYLRARDASG